MQLISTDHQPDPCSSGAPRIVLRSPSAPGNVLLVHAFDSGADGSIFKGKWRSLHESTSVALKVFVRETDAETEANTLKLLSSPGSLPAGAPVLKFYGSICVETDKGPRQAILISLCDSNLLRFLNDTPYLSPRVVLTTIIPVLKLLEFWERCLFIHGDIKPENLLVKKLCGSDFKIIICERSRARGHAPEG